MTNMFSVKTLLIFSLALLVVVFAREWQPQEGLMDKFNPSGEGHRKRPNGGGGHGGGGHGGGGHGGSGHGGGGHGGGGKGKKGKKFFHKTCMRECSDDEKSFSILIKGEECPTDISDRKSLKKVFVKPRKFCDTAEDNEGAPYTKICAYCLTGPKKNPTVVGSDSRTMIRSGSCEKPKDLKEFECQVDGTPTTERE